MRRRYPAAILMGLLGVLGVLSPTVAANEPTIVVSPSHGVCSDELAVVGSGFAPGSDLVITGIFDLIETTSLGTATAGSDGGFVFPIPQEGMPDRCSQGTKLLVAADPVGEAPGVSRATAFFLVDGRWRIELEPAVTDCADPVVVRGFGFAAGEQIFLAWGEVDYFAEAHFTEIGSAQTDAAGEFEASIEMTRRCNQDGAWGLYALVKSERGQPERDGGWVEAVLQVLGPAPDAAATGSATAAASIGTGAISAPTEVATDETAIGDGGDGWPALFSAAIVITALVALAVALRRRKLWF